MMVVSFIWLFLFALVEKSLAFTTVPVVVFVPSTSSSSRTTSTSSSSRRWMSSASTAPTTDDGLIKTISKQGLGEPVRLGDIATVKYTCYLPQQQDNDDNTRSKPLQPPFAKSTKQKVVVGDGTMINGWDKALRTMRVGERSIVRITDVDKLGYGSSGVPPLVPPNSQIEMDIEILDSQPPTANIDFDSLAMSDTTPRTATDIAAAFEARQAVKEPKREGFDGFLDRVKNFYFFGLFEGETGERPPWFLRPSITFPIAFVIVGSAFYVLYLGGGISERGQQVTDELDEIIISMNSIGGDSSSSMTSTTSTVVALATSFLANNPIDI